MSDPIVRIKGRAPAAHPWIWRTRIDNGPRDLVPGAVVEVVDGEGERIGRGLYHPHVTLGLRLLTRDADEEIDVEFFKRRFQTALTLRHDLLRLPEVTDAYRLVHAEADGLSGLMVDVFGDVVKVGVYSRGMAMLQKTIRAALSEVLPGKKIAIRGDRRTMDIEAFGIEARSDDPRETQITENGVRFKIDLRTGHKTGFFCDQRENRAFLSTLTRGKRVLDMHTYTGGFALYAAVRGEAAQVTGVDLDEKAIAVAKRNAKLNQVKNTRFVQSDAFPFLRDLLRTKSEGARPQVLVLDPPKLAKDRNEKEEGLRAYADLNRLGLECIADEGILVTASCSGVVTEDDLLEVLRRGAGRTGREVTILRVAGAAADHPVALHVPETRYLKVVFARVRRW